MDNIYALTDSSIMGKIGTRIKDLRLKQDLTQQNVANEAGVSLSSLKRMEQGVISSFDSLIRVLRTLGKLDVFTSLVDEEPLSPTEYYKMVNNMQRVPVRKRASRDTLSRNQYESEW